MTTTIQHANVYHSGGFTKEAFSFVSDRAVSVSSENEYYIFPGFADVHVHLREPGFSYKETIRTGALAAAHGGYTAVCTMPNLNPVPDSLEHLEEQLAIIRKDASVLVSPIGSITVGEKGKELSDMEALAPYVCAFSDDGVGVADRGMMREAMVRAKALGKVITAHCEDTAYLPADPKSEWSEVERDIMLAKDTGCAFHICHMSSAVTVDLLRQAKKDGINVTGETAPHYLLLDKTMREDSGSWKMNPPLRYPSDREALLEAMCDGTLDAIATDHAPHSAEEKARGFKGSLNGIVGLECAFPVLYTGLVRTGMISLERLIELLSVSPRRRFSLGGGSVTDGEFTIYELDAKQTVRPETFLTMGRSTPFAGREVWGTCIATIYGGKTVWNNATTEN